MLHIDETPVNVGIKKQIRKYLVSSGFENRFWEIATKLAIGKTAVPPKIRP